MLQTGSMETSWFYYVLLMFESGHRPLQLFGRVLQCLFARVMWIKKLHLTFHQHEGEEIMTEFSFLGELSLKFSIAMF